MARREGKCLCGAVRFAAELDDENYAACHCSICRRWTGGPSIEAMAANLEMLEGAPTVYRSTDWGERLFCATCGTHIGFRMQDGSFCGVNPMLFDPPLSGGLSMEIFIDHKPQGYAFHGDHQRLTQEEVMAMMAGGTEGHKT